jgi:hypothetical protein
MRKLSIASLGESQTVPVTVALCLAPLASLGLSISVCAA